MTYQEQQIIYAEKPEGLTTAIGVLQNLYAEYEAQFKQAATDSKSKKLAGIAQISQPSMSLPGGRSRYFRLMFSAGF